MANTPVYLYIHKLKLEHTRYKQLIVIVCAPFVWALLYIMLIN